MSLNLWHDIEIGKNAPEEFNCIIEIPKGSHNKYEIDKETGMIKLDRANYGPSAYPFEYGFVPQTLWEDGDALDVVLLSTYPIPSGILVKVRPVGILDMDDSGEPDSKILAVPVKDLRFENIKDISDVNSHFLKECVNFFETYKQLKGSQDENIVKTNGFKGKTEAMAAIVKSQQMYKEKFNK